MSEADDKYLDKLNNSQPEGFSTSLPFGDYAMDVRAQRVAEWMGKGATTEDALDIPLLTFNTYLVYRMAQIEAEPARMRFEEQRARERREEDEQRRENLESN
jgi:hypothetical protein